jgi:hypothetical protein
MGRGARGEEEQKPRGLIFKKKEGVADFFSRADFISG